MVVMNICCANGFEFHSHLGDFHFGSIVVALFNSWDHFFFTFFKSFQTLGLGVTVKVSVWVWVRFRVYLLRLLRFYQAYYNPVVCYCHVTGGG